jgi:hypothetical protein
VIDFRYHLVSLIAVFLAIALGVTIGATALDGPAAASDGSTGVDRVERDERALEDRVRALEDELATAGAFERAVAPALVEGALAGRSVLVVAAGEDVPAELVEQVGGLVTGAGGTVSGVVRLQRQYSDPATDGGLRTYVTSPGIPAGVQLPATDDAGQLVAALLGQSLLVGDDGSAPDAAAVSSVLAGLAALDVLTVDSSPVAPATSAVVLAGAPAAGGDAAERTRTLVELATALDSAGAGAVVAGTAAATGEHGLVAALRADPELSATVSTVDNGDRAAGRISTVLALAQESGGTSGRYGTGKGTRPLPPAPVAATP